MADTTGTELTVLLLGLSLMRLTLFIILLINNNDSGICFVFLAPIFYFLLVGIYRKQTATLKNFENAPIIELFVGNFE